jgi:hypothetical protein
VVLSQADWRSAVPVDMTTGTVTAVPVIAGTLPPDHGQIWA